MTLPKGCRPQPTLEQEEVIQHWGSPLLVLAGPGTGKTTVLTLRILFLLEEKGIPKDHILAVTFTTKAADEMRSRLVCFGLPEDRHPWIATLHAVAAKILRDHADHVGLAGDFRIARKHDKRFILNDALSSLQFKLPDRVALKELVTRFDRTRYDGLFPREIEDEQLRVLRKQYGKLLLFYQTSDLDGLILGALGILEKSPGVLQRYRKRAQFLLIDEYQDINGAQHRLIQLLAGNPEGVFAVGDDDQSIYSWRGGDPKFILSFSDSFPNAEIKALTLSQRCPGHILQGALSVLSKSKSRIEKDIRSCKPAGEPIRIVVSKSENAEAKWIAEWIQEQVDREQYKPSDISVLSLDQEISKSLFNILRELGINAFKRDKSQLESTSVWRIISLIRLGLNFSDNLAARVCLEVGPVNGIGPVAVRTILAKAEQSGKAIWEIVHSPSRELSRWRKPLQKFREYVEQLREDLRTGDIPSVIRNIAEDLRVVEEEPVHWLLTQTEQLSEQKQVDAASFIQWLQEKRAIDVIEEMAGTGDESGVQFLTMHLVKGLESKVVFIIGLERGLFPDLNKDLDEQRRLLYVAMTRAKELLFLCTAKMRKVRGLSFYEPSPFLQDITSKHVIRINNY